MFMITLADKGKKGKWATRKGERTVCKKQGGNQRAALVTSLRNFSSLSMGKPDHPHWGSAHLRLLMTQIMTSSIPQQAGESAKRSSSPTLPGKGSHPPLTAVSNSRIAKISESLPTLSLSVTCKNPPTHTKIFTTSTQMQLMRWIPHEVVTKSYVELATLMLVNSLEL